MGDVWAEGVTVGQRFHGCLVEDLTRAHIAQYAGASGDFNSVHVDEPFAIEAGRSGVIAHGMLTMGLVGTFLYSVVGHGTLRSFGGRFLAPVMPGDTVRCVLTVKDVQDEKHCRTVSLHVEATTAGGPVFRGEAVAVGQVSDR